MHQDNINNKQKIQNKQNSNVLKPNENNMDKADTPWVTYEPDFE